MDLSASMPLCNEAFLAGRKDIEGTIDNQRAAHQSRTYNPVGLLPDLTGLTGEGISRQREIRRSLYLSKQQEWTQTWVSPILFSQTCLGRTLLACVPFALISWPASSSALV